jgi:DNA-binding NtrC family response regulator
MQLNLPPLRDRGKDILAIAEHCLVRCCRAHSDRDMRFSAKAIQAITTYRWPGNVRELQNAVERAVILCDTNEIDYELLNIDIELVRMGKQAHLHPTGPLRSVAVTDEPEENLSLEDYFQHFVLEHQDSMSETELARKLGVSRKCLWERRQRLGIPRKKTAKTSTAAG